ncbi:MAG: zinc ribbon domain-containing protein [Methanomassiliicoccales archaeon]|nr:zinc ribbon domain-containing protein [Methanomassiliicoccales archaeon]
MERRTSYRECPKCGLRNKPDAVQCDFCGQSLTDEDDWQSHVKDLESLTKYELRGPMDDRTSRRIESTIIRKEGTSQNNVGIREVQGLDEMLRQLEEEPTSKDREVTEPPGGEPETLPEIQGTVMVEPREMEVEVDGEAVTVDEEVSPDEEEGVEEEATPTTTLEEVPMVPEEGEEEAEVPVPTSVTEGSEEMAPPPENESPPPTGVEELETSSESMEDIEIPASTPGTNGSEEFETPPEDESVEGGDEPLSPFGTETSTAQEGGTRGWAVPLPQVATVILVIGALLYIAVIALVVLGDLGRALGLSGGVAASLMMVIGGMLVFPSWKRKGSAEVFICPRCHEEVPRGEEFCPACGAPFLPEDREGFP